MIANRKIRSIGLEPLQNTMNMIQGTLASKPGNLGRYTRFELVIVNCWHVHEAGDWRDMIGIVEAAIIRHTSKDTPSMLELRNTP